MLNREFIVRKLQLIQEDLNYLQPFAHKSFDTIAQNPVEKAAIERYMERLITHAIDINQHIVSELGQAEHDTKTYRDSFLVLATLGVYSSEFAEQIAPSAGLRNALVHEYDNLDEQLMELSIKQAITQFNEYAGKVLQFVDKTTDRSG